MSKNINSQINQRKIDQNLLISTANQIDSALSRLSHRRQTWENGLQRAARHELYAILDECYQHFYKLHSDVKLRKIFNKVIEDQGINSTAGTSLALKVIRLVFGPCTQEHTYAGALKAAVDFKPEDISFAEWLDGQGGPEGIRKTGASSDPKKTSTELIEHAKTHFETAPALTSIKSIAQLEPNPEADHAYAVALVRPSKKTGSVEIVFGSSNQALVNQVLKKAAAKLNGATAKTADTAQSFPELEIIPFRNRSAKSDTDEQEVSA